MKRLGILLCTGVLLACAPYAGAEDKNQIRVQCQFFKFYGNLPGTTSAKEQIWRTDEPPEKLKNRVAVFSEAELDLGAHKLQFKEGRCFWNKTEVPITNPKKLNLPEDRIRWIDSPKIVLYEHSLGSFNLTSTQPIQYLEKREDGLFELKEVGLRTGLDIEITDADESEKHGYIDLTDIVMTMRSVERRRKIEGVNLSVGYPVLEKQKYVFFLRLRPGKDYGIIIRPEYGQGGLLIRLRASSTSSGTFEGEDAPPPEAVLRYAKIFVPHMEVTDWEFDNDQYELVCERGDEEYEFDVMLDGELTELQYKNDETDIQENADHMAFRGTKKSIAVNEVPNKALATLAEAYPGLKPSKAWTADTVAGRRYIIQIGEMAFYARPDGQIQAGERIDKGALNEIDPPSEDKDR
ncbi:MAG: hypothetical protein ACYSP9_01685 [Planctomycetota bacterium]|jgi:hypothetical protein